MLGGLALALTFLALPFTHASAGEQKTEKKWTVKSGHLACAGGAVSALPYLYGWF